MRRRLIDILLLTIGFVLSPLSWWNDLFVNVPLAYLFSWPFSLLGERWFLPAFVTGYWLTNLLGFLLLHWGGEGLVYRGRHTISFRQSLLVSLLYSVIMIVIVLAGWVAPPTEYLQHLQ